MEIPYKGVYVVVGGGGGGQRGGVKKGLWFCKM
jgi:hypothetical protein